MTTAATRTRYRVDGMDCPSCATKIDTAVRRIRGIEDVSVSVSGGMMTIVHSDDGDLTSVERKVRALGFQVAPMPDAARIEPPAVDTCGCCGDKTASLGLNPPPVVVHDHHDHGRDHAGHDHGAHGHAETPAPIASIDGRERNIWWATPKGRLTIASGAALIAAYLVGRLVPMLGTWPFDVAMLVGLIPIARRAIAAALNGTPFSIEMLMSIAAIGAVFIGAGEEAAAVVFLFLVGELLEGVAAGRARGSIQSLANLVPKTALLERGGGTEEVAADRLVVGSTILVRPGDRIPADGIVISGESTVDEAPVTGESTAVHKVANANVFAGTINGDGALRLKVTAAASDNTIARVVRLVEEAQESKAPTERLIDRFSRYYTPAVVFVAALVAIVPPLAFGGIWSAWIYKGLAILLIGCPCALVISTPAAIAASLSAGARRGLLLKGGAVLETLGKINAVAFDKTGTLTEGRPTVTDVVPVGRSEADVIRLAAALETGSSHPLAKAILAAARAKRIDVPGVLDARAVGGQGVTATVDGAAVFLGSPKAAAERAPVPRYTEKAIGALNDEGKTVSVLVVDGTVAGLVALRDEPRADAKAGLDALVRAGVKVVMLTGDNQRAAATIGRNLGIEIKAGLLPQDKQRIVSEMKTSGLTVAKVGDGINDAPALAAADVGIAMGGGTDVALETADAAVLHGRVGDVMAMIDLSKRTMGNIRQNITIALGLKVVFLVTTIAGVTGLWPAILADTGATVLVTANAMRLLSSRNSR
ncbi:ATPase [Beijerinckiaceae bacterium RH CH11]|nr:heavy metal translocating P-type ATPase [Beijerinckiaceae bacterium]VVB50346.1 ATPase [Beijerinckiaceae bacterium RH CH11]VVB50355.1 ATPase [Beijerinckiaceae bacterium RH AL8]